MSTALGLSPQFTNSDFSNSPGVRLPANQTPTKNPKKRSNTSQHLRRMAYWSKLKQDNVNRQNRRKKAQRKAYSAGADPADGPLVEPYFISHRGEHWRNAAHPQRAKYIATIHGELLPTIFDEGHFNILGQPQTLAQSVEVPVGGGSASTGSVSGAISLSDILDFDSKKLNKDIDTRNDVLKEFRNEVQNLKNNSTEQMAENTQNNNLSKSVSAPATAGCNENKVSFNPKKSFERQTLPTWKKSRGWGGSEKFSKKILIFF